MTREFSLRRQYLYFYIDGLTAVGKAARTPLTDYDVKIRQLLPLFRMTSPIGCSLPPRLLGKPPQRVDREELIAKD